MKKLFTLIAITLSLVISLSACAMGPIFVGPKNASWDASVGATSYYLYWRVPGTVTWDNTNRIITTALLVDLVASGVPTGAWEICVTAKDEVSESGPSNIVEWKYIIITSPTNLRKQ